VTGFRIALATAVGFVGLAVSGCVDDAPRGYGGGPVIYSRYDRPDWDSRYQRRSDWEYRHHRRSYDNRWDRDERRGHVDRNDRNNQRDRWDKADNRPHDQVGNRSNDHADSCQPTKWQPCNVQRR